VKNIADVAGGKSIAVLLQSISGESAINTLVAFYDIHGGKREVLFVYFVPDTTRDYPGHHTRQLLYIIINIIPSLAINIVLKKNIFFNCKEHLLLLQYVNLVHKYKTIKNI
jgi:hypothetical protein